MSTMLVMIPLCQLKRSKANVRKTDVTAGIEELAASIVANGVLENLVVFGIEKADLSQPDSYEVTAGGRRLAALKLLAKRNTIPRHHPVPCLVLDRSSGANAVEVSLAENIVRAPIHPADQFDAFAKLQKQGLPAEDIAARFGISAKVVCQRLKLSSVSPRLMAEYRSGKMTLEQLMAFTISDDHKAQEEVWFDSPFADNSVQAIKRLLTKSHVPGTDKRARFVGAKAYEEAGGIIIRDLFDAKDEGYFADSQLLDRLAAEKLQTEAERLKAEGWSWVEPALTTDFGQLSRFDRIKSFEVELPEADEERLGALCERYDELVALLEDEGDEQTVGELDVVSAEIDGLRARKETWPDEDKGRAGVLLSLDSDGTLCAERGLVRPGSKDEVSDEEPGSDGPEPVPSEPASNAKKANGYSDALLADLSAHRTLALRELLAGKPDWALIALLDILVRRIFFHDKGVSCVGITPIVADLGSFSQSVGAGKAAEAFLARRNAWQERLPEPGGLWPWLVQLKDSERLSLLALCVAMTLDAVRRHWEHGTRQGEADRLAEALLLDMADWWRPTRDGFFDRLTKAQILKAVEEGASRQAALQIADRKKAPMCHDAETLLAATHWLPEPLRTPVPEEEVSNEISDAAAE